jgi:hypothetical protein
MPARSTASPIGSSSGFALMVLVSMDRIDSTGGGADIAATHRVSVSMALFMRLPPLARFLADFHDFVIDQ